MTFFLVAQNCPVLKPETFFRLSKSCCNLNKLTRSEVENFTRSAFLNSKLDDLRQTDSANNILGVFHLSIEPMDAAGDTLIRDGYWKSWITSYLSNKLKWGDHFYCIGSGYGYFPIFASCLVGPKGLTVGVEPNPILFKHFARTIQSNFQIHGEAHANILALNFAINSDMSHQNLHCSIPPQICIVEFFLKIQLKQPQPTTRASKVSQEN